MEELVKDMTKSLRQYNGEVNRAVIGINRSFMAVGFIIISFLLLLEMMSWHRYLKQQGGELTWRLMLEVSFKYVIAYFLVATSGQIVVATMQITNMLTKMVGANLSNNMFEFEAIKKGNWAIRIVVNAIAYIFGAVAIMFTKILVFMRFIELYVLRAVSPLIVAFWMSDETKGIAINLLKRTAAVAFQGVLIVILLVIWQAFKIDQNVELAKADWLGTFSGGFSYIGKCALFIIILFQSQRTARSLFQAS